MTGAAARPLPMSLVADRGKGVHAVRSDQVGEETALHDEGGSLQPRMHLELAQDVLDVRPRGLRADDQRPSDRVVVRTLREQRQDLAFPGRQTSDPLEPLVLVPFATE